MVQAAVDNVMAGEMNIFIQDTAGQQFALPVSSNDRLNEIAAAFFEERGWDTGNQRQRAVVELVDPQNPDKTKRLNSEQTAEQSGLWDGAVLRIFPESIAGVVDEHERIARLVRDHRKMKELADWHPRINFTANMDHAPTRYIVTIDYRSFTGLANDGKTPLYADKHQVEITLGADYPRSAPFVKWKTPIFHPNIHPESRNVCLGVLKERYLPGMSVARLVIMLAEMVQYRNFDMSDALNGKAARWSIDPENWHYIKEIGGSPFQGPVADLLNKLKDNQEDRKQFKFTRVTKESG